MIEHDFKISDLKRRFVLENLPETNGKILVIDIISIWYDTLKDHKIKDKFYYMNSNSLLTMDGLICFLVQLNESPKIALTRCHNDFRVTEFNESLCGIVIDNLSYLKQIDNKSLNILWKILNMLSKSYGCWIMTTSYGIEYYQGIENSFNRNNNLKKKLIYPTLLPASYLSEMDCIILRETGSKGRRLK